MQFSVRNTATCAANCQLFLTLGKQLFSVGSMEITGATYTRTNTRGEISIHVTSAHARRDVLVSVLLNKVNNRRLLAVIVQSLNDARARGFRWRWLDACRWTRLMRHVTWLSTRHHRLIDCHCWWRYLLVYCLRNKHR